MIGMEKLAINTPALIIDLDKLDYNIRKMAEFFAGQRSVLRPHIKTHKTPIIAHKQIEAGAMGITCQKLAEAEVMALAGIHDIFIANEIVGANKIRRLVNLAKWTDLKVAVDSVENVRDISMAARERGATVKILVEVNIGMNRCGVYPGKASLDLAREVDKGKGVKFEGLMGYEGHTVFIPEFGEREAAAKVSLQSLIDTKNLLEKDGLECKIVSAGGTGTYSIAGSFPGVTEVEAGSYATMDGKYRSIDKIGKEFKQALTLLATVISRPDVDRAIIDAGKKAITEEFGLPIIDGFESEVELYRLAEEHGFLRTQGTKDNLKAGDQVELIPTHGCTTINLHDCFYGIRSGIVECIWPIQARGMVG